MGLRFRDFFNAVAIMLYVAYACYAATGVVLHVNAQVKISQYEEVKRQQIIAAAPTSEIDSYTKMIASMKSKDTRFTNKTIDRLWKLGAGIAFGMIGHYLIIREIEKRYRERVYIEKGNRYRD